MNNAADLTWTPCKNGKLQKKQPRLGVQSHDSYDICSASMQSRTLCHIYRYGPCTDSTCQTAKKQPPLMEYNKYMLGQLDKMTRLKWNKNSLFAGLLCFRPLLPRLECQNCQKKPVTHYFTINWLLLLLLLFNSSPKKDDTVCGKGHNYLNLQPRNLVITQCIIIIWYKSQLQCICRTVRQPI